MIVLASSADRIRIIVGTAVPFHVHVSYMDFDGNVTTPSRNDFTTSSTGTHSVLEGPASGYRAVHSIFITNTHASSSSDIEVAFWDGTTEVRLKKLVLPAASKISYMDGEGWKVTQTGISK